MISNDINMSKVKTIPNLLPPPPNFDLTCYDKGT